MESIPIFFTQDVVLGCGFNKVKNLLTLPKVEIIVQATLIIKKGEGV